jgi:TIR domain
LVEAWRDKKLWATWTSYEVARFEVCAHADGVIRENDTRGARPIFREGHKYLFASYKQDDAKEVTALLDGLASRGVNIWYDQELDGGQDYGRVIEKRIGDSCGLLLFLSKRVINQPDNSTDWVYSETKTAKSLNRKIIPLQIDDTPLNTRWRAEVGMLHTLDTREPGTLDKIIKIAQDLGATTKVDPTGQAQPSNMQKSNFWPVAALALLIACGFLFLDRQNMARQFESRNTAASPVSVPDIPESQPPTRREQISLPSSEEEARPSRTESATAAKTPPPPAVVPDDYAQSIADQTRTWRYSEGSLRFNGEATLHWEECAGLEKMAEKNKRSVTGKLSEIPEQLKTKNIKLCFYCYSMAIDRERNQSGQQPK